MQWRTKATNCT